MDKPHDFSDKSLKSRNDGSGLSADILQQSAQAAYDETAKTASCAFGAKAETASTT